MDEKESKLREAFANGCTIEEALCYAEMRKIEWLEFLALHADFLHEIEQMRLKPLVKAKMSVVKNLDDPKSSQWYLERRDPEFAPVTKGKMEHTGKDGKDLFPTPIMDITKK